MSGHTGLERLARLETFEQTLQRLRAVENARLSGFVPFPDPVGEDRDQPRIIEWDFTR